MQSISSIIKSLQHEGEKILAQKVYAAAVDEFVEVLRIPRQELGDLTRKLERPLGLFLNDLGLKQSNDPEDRSLNFLPVRVKEPLTLLQGFETELRLNGQRKQVLLFKNEKPFQILQEFFKYKKANPQERTEPRWHQANSFFVRKQDIENYPWANRPDTYR